MRSLLLSFALCFLLSCSSVKPTDYQATLPKLELEQFFNGKLMAYGLVLNRQGALKRRFSATIDANWQDGQGILDENFVFDDGEQQQRIWTIKKQADGRYQGSANDVVGIAEGQTSGSVMHWRYQLMITVDGEPLEVTLDDWLYLLDNKRLMNKSDILKFGIKVGELVLFIEKIDDL
ncbi:DUF3833 domain-containing protein [Pseudoalteromonas fenneropenaei]|uniref:DUF3833 domain-containing protein n=1 Tax=Pseudoalteromonas fenneropenaei TaxID=1737459 RepID=A0ABV7CHI8_9GAMM